MNLLSSLLKYTADQIAALRAKDSSQDTTVSGIDTRLGTAEGKVTNMEAQLATAISAATVDSEVQNIRVGDDNVTYTSAGEAVRTQFSNIKADIDTNVAISNFFEGYIYSDVAVGEEVLTRVYEGNYVSAIIDCYKGDVFVVKGVGGGGGRLWAFTDEDLKLVSKADANVFLDDEAIVAPCKGKLVYNASTTAQLGYSLTHVIKLKGIVDDKVDKEDFNNTIEHLTIYETVVNFDDGYIYDNVEVGATVSTRVYEGSYKCKVINCNKDDKFLLTGLGGGSGRLWVFTDDDLKLVSKSDANARLYNGVIVAPVDGKLIVNASSTDYLGYSLLHYRYLDNIVKNVVAEVDNKVDKVTGKSLSTNDYTDADKAIVTGAVGSLTSKIDLPVSPYSRYGADGQVLRTHGDGTTEWVTQGLPTDEQTAEAVNAWMDANAEESTRNFSRGEMPTVKPLVTFIDDDGSSLFKTTVKPIIEEKNVPFVLAIPTSISGLTVEELKYLQEEDGCEIVSHTHTHATLATLTEAELETEFAATKNWLHENGFTDDVLVYPNGSHNLLVRNVAKRYFKCAIDIENGYNFPPIYQFSMYRQAFCDASQSSWTLSDYTALIDYIIAHGGWIIFKVHCHYETFSSVILSGLIDYIKAADIDIVTVSDGLRIYGNTIEVGDYSQQKTFGGAKGGFAVSKTGHTNKGVDFSDNLLPIDAPISMYHIGGVTACFYDNTAVSGQTVPDSMGGNLFTIRSMNEYGSCQIWMPYANNKIYKRRWDVGTGAWQAWAQV